MVHGLRYDHDCSANLLVAGMQLQDNMLEDSEALDTLHNVLQLLQAGADMQTVPEQVRPAAVLCISALLLSSHKCLQDMIILQHMHITYAM